MPTQPTFESVIAEFSPLLRRYLERSVGNPAVAEDLLQETYIRVARALPGFEGRSSLKTWAFSIATRAAADYFRQPSARAHVVPMDETAEPPAPGNDADETMVVDEMSACVRRVIDGLPEDYRAALVLHDLEGFSVADTATASHCSLATAKIRIHRARTRLRKALQQECAFYQSTGNNLRCDNRG